VYKGLESDTTADISILAGDFNYRMVNEVEGEGKPCKLRCEKFGEMLKTNDFKQYLADWKNSDELHLAMREKRYKKQFSPKQINWIDK
jgi:hypothetical protein